MYFISIFLSVIGSCLAGINSEYARIGATEETVENRNAVLEEIRSNRPS